MALRIFDTDPDAKPVPRKRSGDFVVPVAEFRNGARDANGDPLTLSEWRVVSDDLSTADGIAELLGGAPQDTGKGKLPVVLDTNASVVEVVVAGVSAITEKLILWGPHGPVHECDGEFSLLPDEIGEPCGCPRTMTERKARASKGRGPKPSISIDFHLAGAESLGMLRYRATAWSFAETLWEVKDQLDAVGGPALCNLSLELVEYESKKYGPVSYTKPVLEVRGPAA